jgi:hypothetical protein
MRIDRLKRREFINFIGSAAAWPLDSIDLPIPESFLLRADALLE